MLANVIRDLRYSTRALSTNMIFAATAVIVLSLGIGANTAVFSVAYSVLLKPLAYQDPDRLVVALHEGRNPVSPADFFDYRTQVHAFEHLGAAEAWGGSLQGPERTEVIPGLRVTANLIPMLGVKALLGRAFISGEDQPEASPVLILSYGLWQRRFAGDRSIVGRRILVSDKQYTIVGVMPPQFQFAPFWSTQAEMWSPLVLAPRVADRQGRSLRLFGRLKPGVSISAAQAQMDIVARRLALTYPETNTNVGIEVISLEQKVAGPIRSTLLLLLTTVALVLLIACANITNLLLARAAARKREIAVRLAIGANRLQLVRYLMTESLVLSILGGLGGLLLAKASLALLNGSVPKGSLPRQQDITMDAAVFGFTLLISFLTGVISGMIPAFQSSRLDLAESLKEGGRNATGSAARRRTQNTLVVVEVSLALMLLVGAGLMLKTLRQLNMVDAGFNPRNLLTLELSASKSQYDSAEKRVQLFKHIGESLSSVPGVEEVSAINHLPIGGDVWTFGYSIPGRPAPPPGKEFGAVYRVVRPRYFDTMQIRMIAGRDFTERDNRNAPHVVIINETLARHQWPRESPVGKQIVLREPDHDPLALTIAGVVRNSRQGDWTSVPDDEMYLPYLQRPNAFGVSTLTFVVRTRVKPEALVNPVEQKIWEIDRHLPVSSVSTMEQVISDKLWRSRLTTFLLSAFAGVALLLAGVGIYGVISYSVRQRTQEIGIRIALGATRHEVVRLAIWESLRPVSIGIIAGIVLSAASTRWIATLLYGVEATDMVTLFAVVACMVGVALIAALVPALRAVSINPIAALRHE